MFKKLAIAASLSVLMASPAFATPPSVTPTELCTSASSMTSPTVSYFVRCVGAINGNINSSSNAGDNTMLANTFGGTWVFNSTSNGNGASSGTVNVSSLTGFFVLGIKAADNYSLYLYNRPSGGATTINWNTIGTAVNQNGIAQNISHINIYTGVSGPGEQCITGPNGTCVPTTSTVPEPSTYALMTAGLLGIFAVARRRRSAQV
ncbi:MAG: PEP-CTERM sorting domain-containing protein [Gemmatimonadaceae bacterium]|nr:PEP-CTERM sorting domain-containing protein [Gemmatimonadaceae bacterium]